MHACRHAHARVHSPRRVTAQGLNTASDVAAALTRCKVMVDMGSFGLGEEADDAPSAELPLAQTTVQCAAEA